MIYLLPSIAAWVDVGGDDDDGFGAVQMGAPKVKPRAGPGRATMQADDDDDSADEPLYFRFPFNIADLDQALDRA